MCHQCLIFLVLRGDELNKVPVSQLFALFSCSLSPYHATFDLPSIVPEVNHDVIGAVVPKRGVNRTMVPRLLRIVHFFFRPGDVNKTQAVSFDSARAPASRAASRKTQPMKCRLFLSSPTPVPLTGSTSLESDKAGGGESVPSRQTVRGKSAQRVNGTSRNIFVETVCLLGN